MKTMKTIALFAMVSSLLAATSLFSAEDASTLKGIGVVDFRKLVEESKYGTEGKNQLDAMRQQMVTEIQNTEHDLTEIGTKLRDPEFLDSLSPEAEEELRIKGQSLNQELMMQQQQFMNIYNQAEVHYVQELNMHAMRASQVVAKDQGLDLIFREDAVFFYAPTYDITSSVAAEMDRRYAEEHAESQGSAAGAK